jgi:hypothetical protein
LIDELADLVEGRAPSVVKSRIDAQPGEAAAFAFARHQYKVLISIREDFLADLETLRPRMPAVGFNRLRLQHMNGAAALLVVNQAPQLIDAAVAERVVRFVAAEQDQSPLEELKVEPALLSVVCRELNKKQPWVRHASRRICSPGVRSRCCQISTSEVRPTYRCCGNS